MSGRSDIVDVAGEIRGETQRAFSFYDGAPTVWLPKAHVEWDADVRTMAMPEWLAREKELI